jgi:hypothetical protein
VFAEYKASYLFLSKGKEVAGGKPHRILEIGAGGCVSVAIEKLGNPDCRIVVVDLPEVIAIAFSFLQVNFPELIIVLPNEPEGDADVTFF